MKNFYIFVVLVCFISNTCFAMHRRQRRQPRNQQVQAPVQPAPQADDLPPYSHQNGGQEMGGEAIPLDHVSDPLNGNPGNSGNEAFVQQPPINGLNRAPDELNLNSNNAADDRFYRVAPPGGIDNAPIDISRFSYLRNLLRNLPRGVFLLTRSFGREIVVYVGYQNNLSRTERNIRNAISNLQLQSHTCDSYIRNITSTYILTSVLNPINWINFLTMLDECSAALGVAVDLPQTLENTSRTLLGRNPQQIWNPPQPRLIHPIWRKRLDWAQFGLSMALMGWTLASSEDGLTEILQRDVEIFIFSFFVLALDFFD